MQNSEKLCLQWHDFQENLKTAFGLLRNDREFSDVTLACEDGAQIETHKVILAAASPFFMEILKRNQHPRPLIYMRGVKVEDLAAIVDFLYYGETNVNEENLEAFLTLAEELKLKGLTGSAENEYEIERVQEQIIEPIKQHKEAIPNVQNPQNIFHPNPREEFSSSMPVAIIAGPEAEGLDEQVKSMMGIGENLVRSGERTFRAWICKVCGKESQKADIVRHVEAKHVISNVPHPCNICQKISRSRNGLRKHKLREHSS